MPKDVCCNEGLFNSTLYLGLLVVICLLFSTLFKVFSWEGYLFRESWEEYLFRESWEVGRSICLEEVGRSICFENGRGIFMYMK